VSNNPAQKVPFISASYRSVNGSFGGLHKKMQLIVVSSPQGKRKMSAIRVISN
jgi:hypothetical protein